MATEAFEPILVLYAFLAVVQTVLVMVPGFYYARKGTASVDVRRTLSIVSFNLLLPAMNFFNIISQVSASTIVHYLPFAINTVLSNCTGMMLGWGANEVANTPRHLRYHVIAAAGFGNMNSLPLMIVAAICGQQQLPFYQSLGSQCSSVGWGYVALGSAATQILTYPVAIWLLKARPQPPRSFVQLVRLASQRMSRRGTLQSHPSGRCPLPACWPLCAFHAMPTRGELRPRQGCPLPARLPCNNGRFLVVCVAPVVGQAPAASKATRALL